MISALCSVMQIGGSSRILCVSALNACCGVAQKFLIFGKSGWIGGLLGDILREQGADFEYATARLEDRGAVLADLDRVHFRSIHINLCTCCSGNHAMYQFNQHVAAVMSA